MKSKKNESLPSDSRVGRRTFLKSAGAGVIGFTGMNVLPSAGAIVEPADNPPGSRERKLKQMASNSYAVNQLFKRRTTPGREERPGTVELKKKYRELTLLDFPQFTKDTYPGVVAMDLWSSIFGDVTDDTMFMQVSGRDGQTRPGDFDPSAISSKRWLEKLAARRAVTGTSAIHIELLLSTQRMCQRTHCDQYSTLNPNFAG